MGINHTDMSAQYPEIITELVKKARPDQLRPFSLSSFFSDKPLEEVLQKIDRTTSFFSVYIFMEPPYFFTYDSRNNFVFDRKENSLWLNFFDLIGNFKIEREESEGILRGVNRIEEAGSRSGILSE